MIALFRRIPLVCLLLVCAGLAHAQLSTASLFGTVTDPTGAAIPKANIVITQKETGFTRTLQAKDNGEYRADFLPVGPYKLNVTASGFQTLNREGLVLTVTEDAKVDLQLKPGSEGTTVEVTAEIPLMNTGDSTLGRTVDNVEIDNLPLVDRNVYTLLDLTPGVQNNNNSGSTANGGIINPLGYPEQHVKINGSTDSAASQVAYYLDGGSNMTGLRNTGNPLPNPDAIREFRVDTNNFSAQFGRSSGGVVSVLTKSGTNQFHGSAFEFYRTRNFNATEHALSVKTPYNQHRFGGTVGGPVLRDKIFFFGSYAGFRYISANNFVTNVPSANMRLGNFSENLPSSGLAGTAAACATSGTGNTTATAGTSSTKFYVCKPDALGVTTARTSYANNQVPLTDFDPAILNLVNAKNPDGTPVLPLPNPSQTGDSAYTRRDLSPFRNKTDEQLAKGDIQLTSKQRLTLSYFHQTGESIVNPGSNNILGWSVHDYTFLQHNANLQHVWTLSNSTVNQLFLGYTRLLGGRVAGPAQSLAAFGSTFKQQLSDGSVCGTALQPGCSRPQMAIANWQTMGEAISGPVTGDNVYLARDVVSTTKGQHTFYYGGEANLEKDAQQTLLNNYGVFTFSTSTTSTARTNSSITDFFFGRPASMSQDVPVYANANYWNFGAFLQDDWRILPRLTLNLGVRYDIQTAPVDTQRRTLNFSPGVQSTAVPTAPLGTLFVGDAGVPEGGARTQYEHFSPRLGLAWQPFENGRTIIHAGGGIFFGSISGNVFEFPSNGLPFSGRPSYSKVISVADPYSSDPSEFCANAAGGCTTGTSPYPYVYNPTNVKFFTTPTPIIAFDPNLKWPRIYQFNFGIQQQLTQALAFSATYVGSLSRELPIFNDINYPVFNVTAAGASGASCATTQTQNNCAYANTTGTLNNRRPLNNSVATAGTGFNAATPRYSAVQVIGSTESANYHGLQITAEQRLTAHFSIKGFYVWSKTLQSEPLDSTGNTGNSAATAPEDNTLKYLDKQRSDFDQRHTAVISFVYKPKYGFSNRLVRGVVNGWTVTSIIRVQSGLPYNITTGSDSNQDGMNNDRPNLAPGGSLRNNDVGHSRQAAMLNWVSASNFCQYNNATAVYANGSSTQTGSVPACPQNGAGPAGSDGTVRANSLDAPGRRAIDASLFRDFPLYHDRVKFQLRGESTNVFNLTNLPAPTSTLSSSSFGRINGTIQFGQFSNRIIQVGGRILF